MLRKEERLRITEMVVKHINGRVPVMVQTSALNTSDAIWYSRQAQDAGADSLLILPPYFEGPNADGVYYHYEKIAEAVSIPIVVYNLPQHTGFNFSPQFMQRLKAIDRIKGIKDSTGDMTQIQALLTVCGDDITVINGGDTIMFPAFAAGCPACIWGGVNAMPREAVALYELTVVKQDLPAARALWQKMFPALYFFGTYGVYNAAVKAAANLMGYHVGPTRKPVTPLKKSEMEELKKALRLLSLKEQALP